jgi:hypothetical protein
MLRSQASVLNVRPGTRSVQGDNTGFEKKKIDSTRAGMYPVLGRSSTVPTASSLGFFFDVSVSDFISTYYSGSG